jgi:hypothetical protein
MTVSELIDELRAMPSDATVMLWSRMDDPQHRRVERIELSTTKSDPYAENRCALLVTLLIKDSSSSRGAREMALIFSATA